MRCTQGPAFPKGASESLLGRKEAPDEGRWHDDPQWAPSRAPHHAVCKECSLGWPRRGEAGAGVLLGHLTFRHLLAMMSRPHGNRTGKAWASSASAQMKSSSRRKISPLSPWRLVPEPPPASPFPNTHTHPLASPPLPTPLLLRRSPAFEAENGGFPPPRYRCPYMEEYGSQASSGWRCSIPTGTNRAPPPICACACVRGTTGAMVKPPPLHLRPGSGKRWVYHA